MTTKSEAADAVIALLAEKWPAFSVYERGRRPLALGIHHAILAALGDAVTPQELRAALRRYCGNSGYLRAMAAPDAVRIGLDGQPAGAVAAEEAALAAARLVARKAGKPRQACPAPTPAPTPAPPAPKRLSLADLREAARVRKAQESVAA